MSLTLNHTVYKSVVPKYNYFSFPIAYYCTVNIIIIMSLYIVLRIRMWRVILDTPAKSSPYLRKKIYSNTEFNFF